MARVVLITGVSRFLGVRLACALAADPSIDRVIGVDTVTPDREDRVLLGRTEFVRADVRNPLLGKVLVHAEVDTVVHAALTHSQRSLPGRSAAQDLNLVGTMQLLSACQKSASVRRIVLKSTTAVYGGGPVAPAVLTEADASGEAVRGAWATDAADIEGYLRGLARRRPDIAVAVLRLAPVLGPGIDTPLSRYLARPVVPTPLGCDPRLQVVHEDDAVEALRRATVGDFDGVVNVAGRGVLLLSQALRRAGRLRVPVPPQLLTTVGPALGNPAVADLIAEDPVLLRQGRVVETATLEGEFGFEPACTTAQTLDAFVAAHGPVPRLALLGLGVGSRVFGGRGEPEAVSP